MKANKQRGKHVNVKAYYDQLSEEELAELKQFVQELIEHNYKYKDTEVLLNDKQRDAC